MGQIFDKLQGKEWRDKQRKAIADKVFDGFKNKAGKATLSFEDLYIAVLLIYNDINKHLPGPHFDPPSKPKVKELIDACDINLDGELSQDEFVGFIEKLTTDTAVLVTQQLLLTLVVAPTVATATKKTTEGVPLVGQVVQKIPTTVYASLVTFAILAFQRRGDVSL